MTGINYTQILMLIKDFIMKLPAWRLVLVSLTALLIALFMFADKVALLVQAFR